ncbi:MAG: site-specific integrase [Emergencia sp.]|nr:site-specific integrase [Emergencia sp.]
MAKKTNITIGDKEYYRLVKTVGHKINDAGNEVPVRKQFYGSSKKEAEEKYNAYMHKLQQGINTDRQYFGIAADNWIYNFFLKDNSLKERTKDLYLSCWKKYVVPSKVYPMALSDVSAVVLQDLYNRLDVPTSSLESINKLMRRFYKYLEREGISRNITGSLVIPKADEPHKEKSITVWTDEEVNKIFNSFEKAQNGFRLRFLLVLAYNTGCRISELLGLKYEDFTADGILIRRQTIEKPVFNRDGQTSYSLSVDGLKTSSSYRTIPISSAVMNELASHKAWHNADMLANGYRTDFLFTTASGSFYYRRNVTHALQRYYKRIGVEPKGFHTYRHTFGTNLCRKGVSIQIASSLLGHSDINVTAKYYVDVSASEKMKAIELLSETLIQ